MWSDWNWAKQFLWVIQAHPRTPSHTCAHSATSLYTCTRRVMWKLSWRSFRLPLLFPFCLMASGTSSLPLSSYPSSQFIRLLNQSRCSLLPSLNFIEESGSRSDIATSKRCPELKGVQQRAELSLKYSINLQLIRNLSLICRVSAPKQMQISNFQCFTPLHITEESQCFELLVNWSGRTTGMAVSFHVRVSL